MRECFGLLDLRFKLGPVHDCVGSAGIDLRELTGGVKQ